MKENTRCGAKGVNGIIPYWNIATSGGQHISENFVNLNRRL